MANIKYADPSYTDANATDDDRVMLRTSAGADARAPLVQPKGYIDGLRMVWVSGTQMQITAGAAYIPWPKRIVELSAAVTKTPALSASTWYHIYLYLSGATIDIEVSSTAPASAYSGTARTKTGDTSRRYIGSIKTDSSSQIIKFVQVGGVVTYSGNVSSNIVLNANVTSATNIDVSTYFPVTCISLQILILNQSSTLLYIGYSSGPVPGSNSWVTFTPGGSSQKIEAAYPVPGDNLQAKYDSSSSNGSLGWAAGYTFLR